MMNKRNMVLIFAIALLIVVSVAVAVYISTSPSSIELPTQTTTITTSVKTQTTTSVPTNTGVFQPSVVTLEIKSWGFNPGRVTLLKGSTATWSNKDSVTHTVTSEGNFDSGDILAGGSWTYTFDKAGTFEYTCKHHPSMKATVVVTE